MTNIYTKEEYHLFSPRMKDIIAISENELEAEQNYLIEKKFARKENDTMIVTDPDNYKKHRAIFSTVVSHRASKNPKEIISKLKPEL